MNYDQQIKRTGIFKAQDKYGAPVIIEWQSDGMFAESTISKMATLWECAQQAYVSIEIDFLKAFPEVVGAEPYYKPFEPLFAQGIDNVDWDQATEIMRNMLKHHFVIDISHLSKAVLEAYAHDCSIIVTIKDQQSDALLGFMSFMIRADYAVGDVKAIAAGIMPFAQNRGLGKLMMASLFKIMPHIKRIFLSTRATNATAMRAYKAWGFVRDTNPVQDPQHTFNLDHWMFMDYDATQKNVLQKVAATLISE